MKFTLTESEKNEIRVLYNLNEQGFFDALTKGKNTAEKAIKFEPKNSKSPTELAFKGKRASEVEDIYKVEFIGKPIVHGNFIEFNIREVSKKGLSDGDESLREYTIRYSCNNRTVTRDDGKLLYVIKVSGSQKHEDYLDFDNNVNPDVDNYFKQFCDV